MNKNIEQIVLAGLFIAIGIILPPLFHSVNLGSVISPIHFPVLLCGLLLGWKYGGICGFITPLFAGIIWGMPQQPLALIMGLELATYGIVSGLLYKKLRLFKNPIANLYFSLIVAMVLGRFVFGAINGILFLLDIWGTGFKVFLTTVFITGLPGIILQILIVPALVITIEKRNLYYES